MAVGYRYFLDIFHSVLHDNKPLQAEKDHNARISIILHSLFVTTYQRTSLGLLQKDRVTLAMLLAQASPYKMDKSLVDRILDGGLPGVDVSTEVNRRGEIMGRASTLPIFRDRIGDISPEDWEKFFEEEVAENFVPVIWDTTMPGLWFCLILELALLTFSCSS